jgi:hypothetical protein
MFHMLKTLLLFFLLTFMVGCREKLQKPSEPVQEKKGKQVVKPKKFGSFLFVGVIVHKAGIYKFDVIKKKRKEFWSNYNEEVVELSYSPDRKSAFFLTAGHLGKRSFLPYITRVRLYLIDISTYRVKFIKNLGNGVQIFTQWDSNSNFKVIINRADKIVPTYINQQTYIYNLFGKELLNEVQTYDLTKNPYPRPTHNKVNYNSPGGNYKLVNQSADSTNVYLEENQTNSANFITSNSQQLNEFTWSYDENFLIFSTIDITVSNKTLSSKEPATSRLYIYDIQRKKIIKEWKGNGVKNFFIKNDFLIFDNGFEQKSSITIINYRTLKLFDVIKLKSGCGLRSIPELPDLKA